LDGKIHRIPKDTPILWIEKKNNVKTMQNKKTMGFLQMFRFDQSIDRSV
jgi:hypothetical protein